CLQFALVIILFLSLPLWKKVTSSTNAVLNKDSNVTNDKVIGKPKDEKPLQMKGVKLAMATFLFYSGVEATVGLWGSSFLVSTKGLSKALAARRVSVYYGGIRFGSYSTRFLTFRATTRPLIRTG